MNDLEELKQESKKSRRNHFKREFPLQLGIGILMITIVSYLTNDLVEMPFYQWLMVCLSGVVFLMVPLYKASVPPEPTQADVDFVNKLRQHYKE